MGKMLAIASVVTACGAGALAQGLQAGVTRSASGADVALVAAAIYVSNPNNEWLYVELGFESLRHGRIQPHQDIYLAGPDGAWIPLPDQRTYRANREGIQAMFGALGVSEAAARLPVWRQLPTVCHNVECNDVHLWWTTGLPRVEWAVALVKGTFYRIPLVFRAPSGSWTAGDYVLTIEGPGGSVTRLPITLEQKAG